MSTPKAKASLPDPHELRAVLQVLMAHGVTRAKMGDVEIDFGPYTVIDEEDLKSGGGDA